MAADDLFESDGDPILEWAREKGLLPTNGAAGGAALLEAAAPRMKEQGSAPVIERPGKAGTQEQVEIRLRQLKIDLARVVPGTVVGRIAAELGVTDKAVLNALDRLRKAQDITVDMSGRTRADRTGPPCGHDALGLILDRMGVDLTKEVSMPVLVEAARELETTPEKALGALQRLRRTRGITVKTPPAETQAAAVTGRERLNAARETAAPAPGDVGETAAPLRFLSGSEPEEGARGLALQLAGDLYLLADGKDRELLLTAARLVEGLLR